MRKKLIKKGQYSISGGITNDTLNWNNTADISNRVMKNAGMNFSQPSTYSAGLFNSKITSEGVSKLNSANTVTPKSTGGFGSFMKGNMGTISSIGGGLFDAAGSMLGKKFDDGATDAVIDTASNVAGMFGPWGQATGLAMKGFNFLDKALGKSTKNVNINSGISGYAGSDLNYKGKDFRFTQNVARKKEIRKVNSLKKVAMRGKLNADSNLQQLAARNQAIGNVGITNQTQLSGGQDFSVLTAKKGATLEDIRNYIKVRNIKKEVVQNQNLEEKVENKETVEVQKFLNGGSLIPSGALHKNKHNIEEINSELDGEITKKGIPVISYAEKGDVLEFEEDGKTPKLLAEGGEVIQHAEIEAGEIILNISLTKKLIELMNKGTNDDMIHAGKLLARELMEDTTDNTGLIEKTIGNEN